MQVTLPNVVVLEVVTSDWKDKKYHNLICYELGQKRFPAVKSLRLLPEHLEEVVKLAGKKCSLVASMYIDFKKGNKIDLTYQGVAA